MFLAVLMFVLKFLLDNDHGRIWLAVFAAAMATVFSVLFDDHSPARNHLLNLWAHVV